MEASSAGLIKRSHRYDNPTKKYRVESEGAPVVHVDDVVVAHVLIVLVGQFHAAAAKVVGFPLHQVFVELLRKASPQCHLYRSPLCMGAGMRPSDNCRLQTAAQKYFVATRLLKNKTAEGCLCGFTCEAAWSRHSPLCIHPHFWPAQDTAQWQIAGRMCAHLLVDDLNAEHGHLLAALVEVAQRRLAHQLGADRPVVAVRIQRSDRLARHAAAPARQPRSAPHLILIMHSSVYSSAHS